MEAHDAVRSLAALAQPVRLQVFRALVVAGPEGMTPGALVDAIAVPGTSLSFHLKELLHSGMVTQERNGRNLIYRAAFGQMSALLGYLTENCCEGEPCAVDPVAAGGC
jgi:DNA-binding transcriptional ArsR family regulator